MAGLGSTWQPSYTTIFVSPSAADGSRPKGSPRGRTLGNRPAPHPNAASWTIGCDADTALARRLGGALPAAALRK